MRTDPRREGGELDWAELRRRLLAVAQRTTEQASPSPAELRAILEARARQLARPLPPPIWGGAQREHLRFSRAGELYAVETRFVVQAFPLWDVALLPGAAPPVVAVTGWRGQILRVLDLRQALGLPAAQPGERAVGLVIGTDRPAFVVAVDEVPDQISLGEADLRPPPAGGISRELVRGVTGDAVLVLDMERVVRLHG